MGLAGVALALIRWGICAAAEFVPHSGPFPAVLNDTSMHYDAIECP